MRVDFTATYNEMFHMDCETFEEILTAIGPVVSNEQLTEKLSLTIISSRSEEKHFL